jgi:indole-3-glycerol phosphate synthase
LEAKEEEVVRLQRSGRQLRERAEQGPLPRDFTAALRRPEEVRLLAEVKRRSPSAGPIRPGADAAEIARSYEAGGAAALSILTDERFFDGSLAALEGVRSAVDLPLLRKDFVIAPVQLWEARAAGADAILLIVRILDDSRLADLHALARELAMAVLVEVHDEYELDRALTVDAVIIGINNRDLSTFTTDLSLSERLVPRVPSSVTVVAESGIRTSDDVQRLGAIGVDAILVGESLMRQEDVAAAAALLCGITRDADARRS